MIAIYTEVPMYFLAPSGLFQNEGLPFNKATCCVIREEQQQRLPIHKPDSLLHSGDKFLLMLLPVLLRHDDFLFLQQVITVQPSDSEMLLTESWHLLQFSHNLCCQHTPLEWDSANKTFILKGFRYAHNAFYKIGFFYAQPFRDMA